MNEYSTRRMRKRPPAKKNKVGGPDTEGGRNAAAASERDSGEGDEVVEKDESDGEYEAHALAALFGGEAERDADQGEDEAGGRQGEAAVELDQIPAGAGGGCVLRVARLAGVGFGMVAAVPELASGHFGDGDEFGFGFFGFGECDGQIGLGEGGDLVLLRVLGQGLLLRSLVEVHVDEVGIVGEDDAVAGHGDFGGGRVADIGEEDAAPARGVGAGADILDVEHQVFEIFVKDAGLNFKRGLGAAQLVLQARECGRGGWSQPDVVAEGEQPGEDGEDGDDADELPGAEAAGAHGGDFAIGGQAAEADEDSDEQAHGDGDGAGHGQGEQEELGYGGQGSTVADDDFQQASEVAHEDDESEEGDADGGVLHDFGKNIAGKNLQSATSTGAGRTE